MVFESNSVNETKDFASKFSKTINSGKIIALIWERVRQHLHRVLRLGWALKSMLDLLLSN